MKLIASLFSIALRAGTLMDCGIVPLDLLGDAALAQVRFHVVDQDGTAVPGAKIWGLSRVRYAKTSLAELS